MKIKDIPILKQKVLEMLPITQAEIWKVLGIDHRDVSRLVGVMVKEHIIKKTRVDRSFLLEKNNSNEHKNKICLEEVLLSHGKFSPCCGCELECDPGQCQKLAEWIMGSNSNKDNKKKDDLLPLDEDIKLEDKKRDVQQNENGDKKGEQEQDIYCSFFYLKEHYII